MVVHGRGVADFSALRSAMARREATEAFLYGFDLLELDGRDLRRDPWEARRAALERLLGLAGARIGSSTRTRMRQRCAGKPRRIGVGREDAPKRRPRRNLAGTPMTLGNMRENGVHTLAVYCMSGRCHHNAVLEVDHMPDNVEVPSLAPRMMCTACGLIGADVRPNWGDCRRFRPPVLAE